MGGGGGAPQGQQSAPAEEEAPKEEVKKEKTAYDVELEGYEPSAKLKITKELRTILTTAGLKELKELVEAAPSWI